MFDEEITELKIEAENEVWECLGVGSGVFKTREK
jgi:hypothetical protein